MDCYRKLKYLLLNFDKFDFAQSNTSVAKRYSIDIERYETKEGFSDPESIEFFALNK